MHLTQAGAEHHLISTYIGFADPSNEMLQCTHVALFHNSADAVRGGTLDEVTGTGYSRQPISFVSQVWSDINLRPRPSSIPVTFSRAASNPWGSTAIQSVGLMTAASGGECHWVAPLANVIMVSPTDRTTLEFAAGNLIPEYSPFPEGGYSRIGRFQSFRLHDALLRGIGQPTYFPSFIQIDEGVADNSFGLALHLASSIDESTAVEADEFVTFDGNGYSGSARPSLLPGVGGCQPVEFELEAGSTPRTVHNIREVKFPVATGSGWNISGITSCFAVCMWYASNGTLGIWDFVRLVSTHAVPVTVLNGQQLVIPAGSLRISLE